MAREGLGLGKRRNGSGWRGEKSKGGKGGSGGVRVEKVEGLGVGRVEGEKGKGGRKMVG
jgi:hypothetical protein